MVYQSDNFLATALASNVARLRVYIGHPIESITWCVRLKGSLDNQELREMHVLIFSNKHLDDLNREIFETLREYVGQEVVSATSTTIYISDQRTLSWDGVLYTTTIVLCPVS